MDASVIAFDLEATGLNPEFDRIVEFCLIGLDDELNEVERWTERVNPGIPIPPEVTEIHGISDEDVADLPGFAHHAAKLQGTLANAGTLMAYNHGYDLNLMHYELVRHGQAGLDMDHPVIDPLIIFRQHHPHSLAGAVRHYLDEDLGERAHSAEGDTSAMVDVFRAQLKAHGLPATPDDNVVVRDKRFLDRAKRFYEDKDGVARFGFGKHRDEAVAQHVGYLQWMLAKDFPEETKNVAKQLADTLIEKAPPRQSSL